MPVYPTCRPGFTFIYVLRDPRDDAVRYVGKSSRLYVRFYQHLSRGREFPDRAEWLRDLESEGLRPELIVIEEVILSEWQVRERFWIRFYRDSGASLFNVTDGGEQTTEGSHLSELTRSRISAALRGKSHSPEHCRRVSEALKGRAISDYARQRVSEANRARIISPESRQKMSQSRIGRRTVPRIAIACGYCGMIVYRRPWQLEHSKYGKAFCNGTHASRWLANRHRDT